jgi:hypothetical protein
MNLTRHKIYSWDELARVLGVNANYFSDAGGMFTRPDLNSVIVITHPGGGKSFDYKDEWDGDELIYTGRGKKGNQPYTGATRDVGDNQRDIHAFEHVAPKTLEYLGRAHCTTTGPNATATNEGTNETSSSSDSSSNDRSGAHAAPVRPSGRAHAVLHRGAPLSKQPLTILVLSPPGAGWEARGPVPASAPNVVAVIKSTPIQSRSS